jgi:hypothetical protein
VPWPDRRSAPSARRARAMRPEPRRRRRVHHGGRRPGTRRPGGPAGHCPPGRGGCGTRASTRPVPVPGPGPGARTAPARAAHGAPAGSARPPPGARARPERGAPHGEGPREAAWAGDDRPEGRVPPAGRPLDPDRGRGRPPAHRHGPGSGRAAAARPPAARRRSRWSVLTGRRRRDAACHSSGPRGASYEADPRTLRGNRPRDPDARSGAQRCPDLWASWASKPRRASWHPRSGGQARGRVASNHA